MILKQFYLQCLSHASYLVADPETGDAAVVDPQRDIDLYLEEADALGLRIRHVILTHFHADFLAGHIEMRRATGARIHLGARARAEYEFQPMADGDEIELGSVRLRVLETPGHTPEGICLTVHPTPDAPPHAVLTGDTLFIGDVGRPDLMAAVGHTAEELAGALYDSLHEKILRLPDDTLVYPAHGAGSSCGRSLSNELSARLGDQRGLNESLRPMEKEEFIRRQVEDLPEAPAYFSYDADLNRRERPTLSDTLAAALRPLSAEETLRLRNAGALILDVRDREDYVARHVRGSVYIGLDGRFANWAGSILSPEQRIVLLANPETAAEAAMRLGRIGFDRVEGYVQDGLAAFGDEDEILTGNTRWTPTALAERLEQDSPPLVLDVRTPGETENTPFPAEYLSVPLAHLEEQLAAVPRDREVVALCHSGYRSVIAASLLELHGVPGIRDLEGGMLGWLETYGTGAR